MAEQRYTDEQLAAGRRLFSAPASFRLGVAKLEQLPPLKGTEVAFAGRSNVGKSSLINALTGVNGLARASNTPGRTRELNFFDVDQRITLVDMPGYGYAKAPKAEVKQWQEVLKGYLRGRVGLTRVFVLIDARHGVKAEDREMFDMLDETAVAYQLILTKIGQDQARRTGLGHGRDAGLREEACGGPAAAVCHLVRQAPGLRRAARRNRRTGALSLLSIAAESPIRRDGFPLLPGYRPMTELTVNETARILSEALPFLQRYDDQIIVVKYGGHAMVDPELARMFARDIVMLKVCGLNPIVVHGGGPQINKMLDKLAVKAEFREGLRVTDAETMSVVEMVLAGSINKSIVASIQQAGGKAVGISGKDGNLLIAERYVKEKTDPATGKTVKIDFGQVGEPARVNAEILHTIMKSDAIPVVAPVGVGWEGDTYNVNADTAAGRHRLGDGCQAPAAPHRCGGRARQGQAADQRVEDRRGAAAGGGRNDHRRHDPQDRERRGRG
jgi:ribosome biogenesis GTP-binding protein YsxC/EngB